jgi:DNA-binding XRE family transcriptional regulator
MPFIKSNPEETKRELERLGKTKEGARAIRNFEIEYQFRSQLREARLKANKTQEEVAKISGLQQQAVSRLEKGAQEQGANIATLLKYIDALGFRLAIVNKQE